MILKKTVLVLLIFGAFTMQQANAQYANAFTEHQIEQIIKQIKAHPYLLYNTKMNDRKGGNILTEAEYDLIHITKIEKGKLNAFYSQQKGQNYYAINFKAKVIYRLKHSGNCNTIFTTIETHGTKTGGNIYSNLLYCYDTQLKKATRLDILTQNKVHSVNCKYFDFPTPEIYPKLNKKYIQWYYKNM